MATQDGEALSNTLKTWEIEYQAIRDQLTLQDLQTLRALLARLFEQVDRDATGPSSSPVLASPDAGGS
jgi:hypothetical protein